jgi:hypothetical protein
MATIIVIQQHQSSIIRRRFVDIRGPASGNSVWTSISCVAERLAVVGITLTSRYR